ncbi:MAG: branched-chain-amino-acid transaminase [Limnochordales bacterium]|nr:branched-chain-amino-acid transaminase [Limnochordales bacterium]
MGLLVYLDGRLVPEEEAKISIFDHGLLYGDGVFEGIRLYSGRIFRLEQHLERLYESAASIRLNIPMTREEFKQAIIETVRANKLQDGYIRPVVTRGVGDLGLDPVRCPRPTVFIIASTIQLYPESLYENGLRIGTVSTRKNAPDSLNPRIKSLNYLNNILAKLEANNAGFAEALMLNHQGYVAECAADNIFAVRRGAVLTPPTYVGALAGITRQVVLELAPGLGYQATEAVLTLHDLYTADEVFLTGTAAEIVPVVEIDGRTIGSGKPGPVTRRLRAAFRELTQREGTPVYSS